MQIFHLVIGSPTYPASWIPWLGTFAPAKIDYVGNIEILKLPLLGLFSSVKCPASLILAAHDLAHQLSKEQTPIVSGFHAPVEKEMLAVLLRGNTPLVICLARGLEGLRIPVAWHPSLEKGRLLLLSAFPNTTKRANHITTTERNRIVGALSEKTLVIYAEPRGKTEMLCKELLKWKKTVFTLAGEHNDNLIGLGVLPFTAFRGINPNR